MKKTRPLLLVLPLLALLATDHQRVRGAEPPFFMELPPEALPQKVDAHGWVSVGIRFGEVGQGMYWMPSTGMVAIGGTGAITVSRDGKTIVGNALDSRGRENAAIWTERRTWRLLGSFTPDAESCDRSYSSTYDTSADGSVIVGLAWDGCKFARAFRWDERTGIVNLGSLGGESTRANAISSDGQVIVGWEQHLTGFRQAAKWVNGTEQLIKSPSGGLMGEARGVNHDGSLIVGSGCEPERATPPATGWMWTPSRGVQCLPVELPRWLPPLPYQVLVMRTSDDGRVMAGSFSFGLDAEALIWLDGQVYFLRDYLRDNGLPDAFRGWQNTGFVTGVTPDGRTLVGYGAGPTTFQGYMVVLPDRGKS